MDGLFIGSKYVERCFFIPTAVHHYRIDVGSLWSRSIDREALFGPLGSPLDPSFFGPTWPNKSASLHPLHGFLVQMNVVTDRASVPCLVRAPSTKRGPFPLVLFRWGILLLVFFFPGQLNANAMVDWTVWLNRSAERNWGKLEVSRTLKSDHIKLREEYVNSTSLFYIWINLDLHTSAFCLVLWTRTSS